MRTKTPSCIIRSSDMSLLKLCYTAYYIAYGPHGPRAPIVPPNTNGKVFVGTIACIVAAGGVFALVRANCQWLSCRKVQVLRDADHLPLRLHSTIHLLPAPQTPSLALLCQSPLPGPYRNLAIVEM